MKENLTQNWTNTSTNKVARLSNFVENIILKKSYEPARAFRDLWSLAMF